MITDINAKTLDLIKNRTFREDAERYVLQYADFMKFAEDSGIGAVEGASSNSIAAERLLKNSRIKGYNAKSLSYGYLSPACTDCRTGENSKTVFHTLTCNRDCYFCANMNQEEYDFYTKNINNAEEELDASMAGKKVSSVALTGGEPLLLPERAVSFFKHAAEKYPEAHRRLYTNGDLLTDDLAEQLAAAGLNEIRISVKMDKDGYPAETLDKLRTARKFIPVVMVEMPVIPGTFEHMKDLLLKMDEIGCDGINILEFLYPWTDAEEYKKLGFKIKSRPYHVLYSYNYSGGLPVAGSEEECLRLLEFALEKGLKLGVHYCSLENKLTSQVYSQNSSTKLMPFEVMSEKDFFIKIARVYGGNAGKVQKFLGKKGAPFQRLAGSDALEFHPRYIPELRGVEEVALTYNIVETEGKSSHMREVKIDLVNPALFDYDEDI